jgi:HTH-type transcriptional regulator, sugar sensing transcriptional regulator
MEIITKLQQIGLTKREAEIYIALLQKNEFTAPELAKITTITRTKIYEILQNLILKGVCNETYRDGNKVYHAVQPKIALQNVIANYEMITEQKQKELYLHKKAEIEQKKRAAVTLEEELTLLHDSGIKNFETLDYIEVLTDRGQIKERWLTIQENTSRELLIFTKPPYTGTLEDNLDDQSNLLKNKVTYRSIYEYKDVKNDAEKEELIKIVKSYIKLGEEARLTGELPMKLVISDETVSMFALNDRISLKPSITTMIVNHPSFASAMKKVFEAIWNSSVTLEEYMDSEKSTNPLTNQYEVI